MNFFLHINIKQQCCSFSSKAGDNPSIIIPAITYFNSDLEKDRILKENKKKAVVYR